ncbi:MAG: Helicase protein [uncultured bacterium]|nr:MAG: Helicase protein [uncultured bacterium]
MTIPQKNRLHPYYLVYIGMDGTVIADHTEVKSLLDLARTACKGLSEPVPAVFEPFNKATNDGRNMKVYSTLLDQAIHSMIERQQEQEVDSLFSPGKTSALTQNLTGIEDFELVSFLVIQAQ